MKKFTGMIIVIGLLIASCTRQEGTPILSDHDSGSVEKAAKRLSSTQRMVKRLEEINANAVPQLNYHLNMRRAGEIYASIPGTTGAARVQLYFDYALELLNAGQTQEAITTLEDLIQSIGADEFQINDGNRTIFEILAVAYLRRGEQQNCIANHSPESCIVPISGNGIHVLTASSKKAIDVYAALLKKYPDDLQSRWLLNLAYMTLGDYPDAVPEQWRIGGLSQPDHVSFPRVQ